jgi:hypothetical protein
MGENKGELIRELGLKEGLAVGLRSARPRWYRPSFQTPLSPVLPLVTALLCLSVILTMDAFSRVAGVGLVALSLVWYGVWVRKKALVNGQIWAAMGAATAPGERHRGGRNGGAEGEERGVDSIAGGRRPRLVAVTGHRAGSSR